MTCNLMTVKYSGEQTDERRFKNFVRQNLSESIRTKFTETV